jgi:thiosulfate reductase/polysulfide reductase chain A
VLSADALKTAFYDGDATKDGTLVYDKDKASGGVVIGVVVGGKGVKGFATPSRKVEFYAKGLDGKKDAAGKAVNPLPAYEPRDWQPDDEFPLYLINWKEASHTHSRTFNNAWLLELKSENPLIIHPDTAKKLGVGDGDEVDVESPYGKTRAKAKVSKRMHPEVVGLQHGFGHWAGGSNAKGRGTADGNLRPTKGDPLSGQSLHKENCVKVSKA